METFWIILLFVFLIRYEHILESTRDHTKQIVKLLEEIKKVIEKNG